MSLQLLRFHFSGPVHFGEAGIGIEEVKSTLHSDTLFSAICNSWVELFGSDDLYKNFIQPIQSDSRKLRFSSLFYFDKNNYYLPRPVTNPKAMDNSDTILHGKTVRQAKYVPLNIFLDWVKGNHLDLYRKISDSGQKYKQCYEEYVTPKVSLHRESRESNIFHCGLVRFREGCGLYSIIDIEDELLEKLKATVRYLGETGIGGKRTIGYGSFKPEWISIEINSLWDELFKPLEGEQAYCTLSLVNPELTEISSEILTNSAYTITQRKGWIYSSSINKQMRKKSCRMFLEGSIFPQLIKGRLVDVTPKNWAGAGFHSIYRYGLALMVPIRRLY